MQMLYHAFLLIYVPVTQVCPELAVEDARRAQQSDKTLHQIWQYLSVQKKQTSNQDWKKHPLKRYAQILKQLHITDDGVLCRSFVLRPLGDALTVPVLPPSLQTFALNKSHDIISAAGHQGVQKTLECLRHTAEPVKSVNDLSCLCHYLFL